jgi:hypothetical protein
MFNEVKLVRQIDGNFSIDVVLVLVADQEHLYEINAVRFSKSLIIK